jgi:hypothetical protein
MTDEERQQMRTRRQQQREQNGERQRSEQAKTDADKNRSGAGALPQVWAGVAPQIRRDGGEAVVKVVTADGRIEERKIKTGITNRVQLQVLEGLADGDRVVIGRKPPPGAASAQGGGNERNALQAQTNIPGAGGGRPR